MTVNLAYLDLEHSANDAACDGDEHSNDDGAICTPNPCNLTWLHSVSDPPTNRQTNNLANKRHSL